MSGTWPKVIRDPIHDLITFENNDCDRLLLALIDAKEFQRLRRIKQLGMSELVFPAANHSRFAHSLGVMNMARKFLARLERESGQRIPDEQRTALLAAALLHDTGHGPFSHTFEAVTDEDHEARTREIIADSSTDVHQRLRRFDRKLPDQLAAFFEDTETANGPSLPAYLGQIVSSQLDADRFDYLLRDSFATGTEYGRFDATWLIEHLHFDLGKQRLFLSHKALFAAEAYILARYHMYRIVYFHKTTRAAEVMLRLLFKRYKELLGKARAETGRKKVVPDAPPALRGAFGGSTMALGEYLALDDAAVLEFLKACEKSSDATLRNLALGVLERKLYKAIDASEAHSSAVGNFRAAASELLQKQDEAPEYALVEDTPGDTAYKPYDPDADKPATQIYVATTLSGVKEISTLSGAIDQLRTGYTLLRYYYPERLRAKMEKLAVDKLKKE